MISTPRLASIVLLGGLAFYGRAAGQEPVGAQPTHVSITGDQFTYNGTVYRVKGTNYYPQDHMWAAMWSSWDWTEITSEIPMIRSLGMNSVRILVPYSNGGWNGPNVPASRLQMLEDIVNQMGKSGIRSCVTLFDWETSFPAAGTSKETDHIKYLNAIVTRLKNNPYVLCWDVKNEPDHPSNISGYDNWDSSPADRDKIVSWLNRMCNAVRARDPLHGVSAGIRWWQNVQDVISFEDIAMFHSYWPNIDTQEIPDVKSYMGTNQKPILVEEFGWPSNPTPGYNGGQLVSSYTEADQLSFYTTHLTAFSHHNIAGGIQWMTFDATPYSSSPNESFENHFGFWRYGYTALKPAGAYYRDHFVVMPFPVEPDGTSPGPVTNLAVQTTNMGVVLTWTNSADSDYSGALIRCKLTGYPTGPTDGTLLADVGGSRSAGSGYTQTNFLYGTRYYYAVFAHDAGGNCATPATATIVSKIPSDFDGDGDIDMTDFAHMQACITGAFIPQTAPACQDTRLDSDNDVDMSDLNLLLKCLSGPELAIVPNCVNPG